MDLDHPAGALCISHQRLILLLQGTIDVLPTPELTPADPHRHDQMTVGRKILGIAPHLSFEIGKILRHLAHDNDGRGRSARARSQ